MTWRYQAGHMQTSSWSSSWWGPKAPQAFSKLAAIANASRRREPGRRRAFPLAHTRVEYGVQSSRRVTWWLAPREEDLCQPNRAEACCAQPVSVFTACREDDDYSVMTTILVPKSLKVVTFALV